VLHPAFLGKDDGLSGLACVALYQPATWRSRDGRVWFATRTGLLCVDPREATRHQRAPVVRVEAAAYDDRPAPLTGFAPPTENRKLQFRFSVLCLDAPELVRAQYRLVGFDSEWIPAEPGFTAVYPRLPPGDYRFSVRAGLTGAPGLESSDEFAFTVPARWWETWTARMALMLFGGTLIALGARTVSNRRLKARLHLAEQESALQHERTRIARNIHDDMGAGLTQVSLLTQDEDLETSASRMDRIYGIVTGLTRSMDEIVWAVDPKFDDLDGLVYYIGNCAQELLSAANVRCRIEAPEQPTERRLTSQVRHQLFLCCKEALHNVVKHAAAQEVTLTIRLEDDLLRVEVADDGAGLKARRNSAGSRGRGNGLENMRSRMAEIGGRCEIQDRNPQGTAVIFIVPLLADTKP
jgi:signal transduction histidine kinase